MYLFVVTFATMNSKLNVALNQKESTKLIQNLEPGTWNLKTYLRK